MESLISSKVQFVLLGSGEEKYHKGYYFITIDQGNLIPEFRPTDPRPMLVEVINLDGAKDADEAQVRFREQVAACFDKLDDARSPLLELKLAGLVHFHPFELGREQLRLILDEYTSPLHVEIKNHLSLVARKGGVEVVKKSLAEIEEEVLHGLIETHSEYKGREEELARLSMAIRDLVLKGNVDDDELLELIAGKS